MKRVEEPVPDALAKNRLKEYRTTHGTGPHKAATLAAVIWPDTKWVASQGAGAAASRVLKRLGCYWDSDGIFCGWMLIFK